jgi:hypothetical protein
MQPVPKQIELNQVVGGVKGTVLPSYISEFQQITYDFE